MRIYTCAPTPPVPRPAWASAAGSRATTPPGPIRHSAIGRPMRSTNHRRSRGLLRHRSVWQHDRHYSPQGDRPELRSLSRLSKLGGPAQNIVKTSILRLLFEKLYSLKSETAKWRVQQAISNLVGDGLLEKVERGSYRKANGVEVST